jgi:UDP-3-O-[3-hydroxymyristoyl] glucosamine N-acyltransferase
LGFFGTRKEKSQKIRARGMRTPFSRKGIRGFSRKPRLSYSTPLYPPEERVVMPHALKIAEIAAAIDARLEGDGAFVITRLAHPANVKGAGDLALASDPALLPIAVESGVKAIVVGEGAVVPANVFKAVLYVSRPRYAMAKLTALFAEEVKIPVGVHPTAVVEPSAKIGANVAIGPMVYVGEGAVIGENSVLHPQVYIGPKAEIGPDALIHAGVKIGQSIKIGARAIIHFNSSIGSDGFSFVTPEAGSVESAKTTGAVGATNQRLCRISSLGGVVIGDDVEIGANTSIDNGTIIATRIGNGTKIDNQVQIGHNVVVGENVMLCGRVGIAGSAEIGNRVVLGGAAGVADHVRIGDDAIAMGMSGIAGNVPAKSIVGGAPAKPRQKMIEDQFNIGRLKGLYGKVEALMKRVDELEESAKCE